MGNRLAEKVAVVTTSVSAGPCPEQAASATSLTSSPLLAPCPLSLPVPVRLMVQRIYPIT